MLINLQKNDIYAVEHKVLKDAFDDWLAMSRDSATEDLQWVCGIVDMANALIAKIDAEVDGNADCDC